MTKLPNGDRFFDIPPGSLSGALVADLRSWLHARLPRPSAGSSVVLDYIKEIEPTVYLRGLQQVAALQPEFYLQITFSGCAGQAETSARVASHWASLWHAAERERIESGHFAPFGFTAAPLESGEEEAMMFLPAGDLGYLEYNADGSLDPDPPLFELDQSVAEAHEGNPILDRLDETFTPYMSPPRCRCQLCEPGFGDAT